MTTKGDYKTYLNQLENLLHEYLVKKAPALPENIKEVIVKFAPWAMVVIFIVTLPAVLTVFGLSALLSPFSFLLGGVTVGTNFIITLIFSGIQLVLEAMAIPGLFKRERKAWNLVYYAALVGGVQNIATFSLGSLLIGTLLSLYILFQVREYYK
ncbi:chromate transporter [Candidatus Roizmanbacteria bacterium]|nr:chromate transporter [Candidatus Roizmanbacteria bacterium]